MKYRNHTYTWSKPYGNPRHRWSLILKEGAIDFHISLVPGYETTAGLEFHHIEGSGAPNHIDCPLTGGRCWHDGTSLYAIETLWPIIEPKLERNDHKGIFKALE